MVEEHTPAELRSLLAPRYWGAWLLIGLLRLSIWLPYRLILPLGRGVGWIALRLGHKRRRIAEINLRLCFPERTEEERAALVREHFASLGIALFEMARAFWAADRRLRPLAHMQGVENLFDALDRGKGVILLSAHFTSLELCGRLLSLFTEFDSMYRKHANPVIEWVQGGARKRVCGHAIARHDVRALIRSLRDNHVVWYAPDQNANRREALFVNFFGIPASTNTGTVRISKLSGAAVVPYRVSRRKDGSGYDLVIEPALEGFPGADPHEDTQRINDLIEGWVRDNPGQYLWTHRRFRTRPNRSEPSLYAG